MVTLFTTGCCGDINHINVNWAAPQERPREAARMGVILAGEVLRTWPEAQGRSPPAALRVRSDRSSFPCPRSRPRTSRSARAVVARREDKSRPVPVPRTGPGVQGPGCRGPRGQAARGRGPGHRPGRPLCLGLPAGGDLRGAGPGDQAGLAVQAHDHRRAGQRAHRLHPLAPRLRAGELRGGRAPAARRVRARCWWTRRWRCSRSSTWRLPGTGRSKPGTIFALPGPARGLREGGVRLEPKTDPKNLETQQKALAINLDRRKYGTFAEIGAGQEVVRWFFRVGGAAGTIAKSISAYDMTVSDAIYGKCERYVVAAAARDDARLRARAEPGAPRAKRGATPTSSPSPTRSPARNFNGTNECHGWMGVKFQAHPRAERQPDHPPRAHARHGERVRSRRRSASSASTCSTARSSIYHEPDDAGRIAARQPDHRAHRDRHDRVLGHRVPARRQPRDEPEAGAARPERRGDVLGRRARCCSRPRCSTRSRSWSSAAASARSRTSTSTCSSRAHEQFVQHVASAVKGERARSCR